MLLHTLLNFLAFLVPTITFPLQVSNVLTFTIQHKDVGEGFGEHRLDTPSCRQTTLKREWNLSRNLTNGVTQTTVLNNECPGYQGQNLPHPHMLPGARGEQSQVRLFGIIDHFAAPEKCPSIYMKPRRN